jgi:LemA protein
MDSTASAMVSIFGLLTSVVPMMLIGLLVLAVAIWSLYNGLIEKKNNVTRVYGSMDALLTKRFDLIPNLVATVKAYALHESQTLEQVTAMRSKIAQPNLPEATKANLQQELGQAMGQLMVQVEAYPELKANDNFVQLQRTLTEIEEQLSAARRAYNTAVTDYNNALEMVPTNVIAGFMNLKPATLYQATETQRTVVPQVAQLFAS